MGQLMGKEMCGGICGDSKLSDFFAAILLFDLSQFWFHVTLLILMALIQSGWDEYGIAYDSPSSNITVRCVSGSST
ncbi:hypothetical protein VNO77_28015 [Canavalia gladiata]|uniref:Uncharacterized protein n=1 Tax=Canavalia gladiata TaxID=3824 RepID=A0AAN9Q4M0_CANGL